MKTRVNEVSNHAYIRWLERVNPRADRESVLEKANEMIPDMDDHIGEDGNEHYVGDTHELIVDPTEARLVTVLPA